ncbi:MAG TPA: hypothetical protein VFW89_09930 [Gemmatimonadaceae bacterium]|nr:hypothetical protein [Gemmatimonadaceae bacterium]
MNRDGQIDLEYPDQRLVDMQLSKMKLIHNADFLPDWCSFSGTSFEASPQAEFARAYLESDERFDFRSTRYYQLAEQGRLPFPCSGPRAATLRSQDFIYLIHRLRTVGYRPNEFGPISVTECADGSYAVVNGKHRMAALLALGVECAALVLAFDNEVRELYRLRAERAWPRRCYQKSFALLDRLGRPCAEAQRVDALIGRMKAAKMETWADIYHPLPFREFRNLTTQVAPETPYRRLALILKHAGNVGGAKILDLGCNLGFYSFSLARRGAEAIGVEIREDYTGFSTEVADIYKLPIRFINEPLTPELLDRVGPVDITLCFSMLQWVIDQKGMDYGCRLLRRISQKSRMLFFDISVNAGKACLKCPSGEEIVFVDKLLRDNTEFSHIEYIGRVHPYGTDVRHQFKCER